MKKLFLLLASVFLIGCETQPTAEVTASAATETETTLYLIRHSEKDLSNPENKDPELTETGRERAEGWSAILKDVPVDRVYATPYLRTRQTAAPLAALKQLEVLTYAPDGFRTPESRQELMGHTALLVGHSNTIPALVNAIIGEERYKDLDETVHGDLFIVRISNGKASAQVLHLP